MPGVPRKFVGALLLALLACTPLAHGFYDGEDNMVVNLDSKSFQEEVLDSDNAVWMVEFYAPWCGHCKKLVPTYKKVAKNLEGIVNVGATDCDANSELCSKHGVKAFPTIKIFTDKAEFNPYTKKTMKIGKDLGGVRSATDMVKTVLEMVPDYVQNVTADSLDSFLSTADYPKVLLFSDKTSPPAMLKGLAVTLQSKLRIGMAHSDNAELAAKFGVEEFPKLVAIEGSDASKAVVHEGKLKQNEVAEFMHKYALKEKRADPLLGKGSSSSGSVKAFADEAEFTAMAEDKKKIYTVYFHKGGSVPAEVSTMAAGFKSFKHASVDCAKLPNVCKEQVVTKFPALRVYMLNKDDYEEFTGGADCLEDCMDIEAMSDFVTESIPNIVMPVDQTSFPMFLQGVATQPKVMLFTKKSEPTALYKGVALNYMDILPFGLFANPPKQMLEEVGLKDMKLPMLLVFFSTNGTAESVQGMPYQGGFNYEEMTAMFDQFAEPLRRKGGPGKGGSEPGSAASPAPTGPIPQIEKEGADYEKLCGSRGGLCAIAFLDGMESNTEKREEQLKVLEELRTKMHPSPFHMSWVDATCHSEFAMSFEVSQDRVPTMAVVSPSKGRYLQHIGKFSREELQSTLQGVVSGKKSTGPFSAVNPLESRACKEVHDEITAAMSGGGSEEDDEIMREMMEELAAKQKAAEEEEEEESPKKKKKKSKKKKGKK